MVLDDHSTASSAQKLAAVIWRLQIPSKSFSPSGAHGYLSSHCICNHRNSHMRGNHLHIHHERTASAMEKSTHWDHPNCSPDETDLYYDLSSAQNRVADLRTECDEWRKKLRHLIRKSITRREDEEILKISLKSEVDREKKERRLQESLNLKLSDDVAAVEAAARQYCHEYDKEKKARMILEEVYEDMVDEAREIKAEMKHLRNEIKEIYEEMDMEKRMLQVAETWREERAKIKMMDAKSVLEEKHRQFCAVWSDLQRRHDDDVDNNSSTEETTSRSDEVDSSVPSVG